MSDAEIFQSYNLYLCIFVLYLSGSIASAGGIGGGGVNVPLLLVLGGYSYHKAVVFSLCTVLGNHLAQSYINWPVSHPFVRQRPLIYWDLILFLLPTQLGGSNLGVIISHAPPEILMLSCAFLVLTLAIAKTYYKGIAYYREEKKSYRTLKYQKLVSYAADCENESRNQSLQSSSIIIDSKDENTTPLLADEEKNLLSSLGPIKEEDPAELSILSLNNDFDFTITTNFPDDGVPINREESEQSPLAYSVAAGSSSSGYDDILLSVNSSHPQGVAGPVEHPSPRTYSSSVSKVVHRLLPYQILQILAAIFLIYVGFFLILEYTVDSCSYQYYILIGALYPPLLAFIYWAIKFVKHRQHHEPFYSIQKGDIDMEKQSMVLIFSIFCVGILSTLLGIGGGELMGPLFLTYHLLPPVSTATTSMMSLINTGNNIVHYAIAGEIDYAVGVVFFLVGLSAGATGRFTALHLVNKYKKNSILVFMLLIILSISAILVIYEIGMSEKDFSFHSIC